MFCKISSRVCNLFCFGEKIITLHYIDVMCPLPFSLCVINHPLSIVTCLNSNIIEHVAIDSHGNIFVVDCHNRCILLVDAHLSLRRVIIDEHQLNKSPLRLCYREQSGQLSVGFRYPGGVAVFDVLCGHWQVTHSGWSPKSVRGECEQCEVCLWSLRRDDRTMYAVYMFQQLVGYTEVYFQHSYPRFVVNLLRLTC